MDSEDYRNRRLFLGLTQKELASFLGVTTRTVSKRETGHFISTEAALALKLLCDLHEQFTTPEEMEFYMRQVESRFRGDPEFQAELRDLELMNDKPITRRSMRH